ncbi:MAG: YggS family pyridoxal phosphate-dependent enzyme [Rickettsiales bacterium]|jgi:pyridoxal phosphate enzyme (YggS family)|nr:YggS family pyridoxal phosphate-dependent enzyme [Rickettsiales bacterium]
MPIAPLTTPSIANNLLALQEHITTTARAASRPVSDITLVAVSKTHPAEIILDALEAGQRVFGENRVQESLQKWPGLRAKFPDVELHLIGPLQTNKTPEAVALFDVIHTVDREKLAVALKTEMEKQGKYPKCLIQVNTGKEPQKAGILPEEANRFIPFCRDTLGLPVIGLMCIPPVEEDPTPHFTLLRTLASEHGLSELSMGMSGDYEAAIACGATYIRIGSAIFGQREYN